MVMKEVIGRIRPFLGNPKFLWLRYVVAFVLLATFITVDHFHAEEALAQARDDADTINLTGRQRMLSQRIVYFADEIEEGNPDQSFEMIRAELDRSIAAFEANHHKLTTRADMSPGEREIYFGACEGCGLDALAHSFIADARTVRERGAGMRRALDRIEQAGISDLIERLDAVTLSFTHHAKEDIGNIALGNRDYYAFAMILLVAEGLLIFLPAQVSLNRFVQEIGDRIDDLTDSNASLAKARSDFLAVMSHEIRTPINGMLGVLQLLQHSKLTDDAAELVTLGRQSGEHLMGLVTDILEMSRLQAGKSVVEPRSFNIVRTVSAVVQAHKVSAEQKGLAITIMQKGDSIPTLLGDEAKLRQIVNNLVNNAVKFTLHGSVAVSIACDIQKTGDTARIEIAVTDTGIGISAENLAGLFEPFEQVEDPYRRQFGGAGLGLAISRSLADLMGAAFTAESVPGQGSTFRLALVLPIHAQARLPGASEQVAAKAKQLAGKRVLVAEDVDIAAAVLRQLLVGRWQMDAVFVANGMEAIDACRRGHFDIILMDIHMPVMNGIEATWRIREFDGYRDTPIVAVTANVSHDDFADYRKCGMQHCLSKPLNWQELKKVLLATLVDGKKPPAASTFPDWVNVATQKILAGRAEEEGLARITDDLRQLRASVSVICDQLDMNRNQPAQIVGLCQKLRDIDAQYGFEFMTPFARHIETHIDDPMEIQTMSLEIQRKMAELIDSLSDDDMI